MRVTIAIVAALLTGAASAQELSADQKAQVQKAAAGVMIGAECETRFGEADRFDRAVATAKEVFTKHNFEDRYLADLINEAKKQAAKPDPKLESFVRSMCNGL